MLMRKRTEVILVKGLMCVLVVPLVNQNCNDILIWSHDIFGSGDWLKVPTDHRICEPLYSSVELQLVHYYFLSII